ncbi:putative tail fiber [Escherichia phage FS2B]|nr:putative tail fiber [Escherichia phage FS2B]
MQPEDTNFWIAHGVSYAGSGGEASQYGRISYAIKIADGTIKYVHCLTNKNTTVDVNGFIKAASPVVHIYSDGRYETNEESEGVNVIRQGVGEYLITGCLGLNADAKWGGIDGGFEIPTDRNKQPRVWLDYEIKEDGSILVKTYHRTHPTSPVFARNEIEGFSDGDPIDIPSDAFISVRVEMPSE